MPVTVKNPVIKQRLARSSAITVGPGLKQIQGDKIKDAQSRGWNRYNTTNIITEEDSVTKGRVFIKDTISGNSTATDKQIGGWLQFGRGWVFPIKAQVLRWVSKAGDVIFAKKAKPTKTQPWWGLSETIKENVRKLYKRLLFK